MLTDAEVRRAKPLRQARKLTDGRGLYLLVAPNGGRYRRYNYRFDGKQMTLALGVYADVSLAKARVRHQVAREQLADGIDPSTVKRASRKGSKTVAREQRKTGPQAHRGLHLSQAASMPSSRAIA